ncbi:MAG: flagellar filament capping protein FliD, partial [Gammaproteobacteria bacterium]
DDISLGPSPTITITEETKGVNPWITRNSNSISDALTGITLNLHDINDVDSGDNPIPVEITVSRNIAAVSQKILSLVSAYNALMTELKSKTEYDDETKKMGILSNDIAVSFIKAQSRDPFIGIVDGFIGTIDTYIQPMDIGLTIDATGMMEFDTDEFNEAISEDYTNVLELLGATKSGNSTSNIIQFYSAGDTYTTAGTYDVEVDINANAITGVRIKLSTESSFRNNSTWSNGLVTGMSIFDDGDPVYPEHDLRFTVDLTQANGPYTATVYVKQGMAGAFEDFLDEILKEDGRFDVSKTVLDDRITAMDRRIENEEARLTRVETRLIAKNARLEKTLILLQRQMAAISMVNQATFGS